ncbi:DUF695 domain-containing protein [Sphingobacterium sp. SGR-19]|uniref:DUF695 domain-containing protein n=1 Tax=Sphingobacterium sp. SGR-19 TaxID=2710886 RepID=UPI0013EAA640|nr:DUF695 domain-containing protein [Sphingobacterium sp. SGR-19]NGM65096.1 DUF695 domain-containing protein [Sphingobacterium sp. SGR-19]
MTLRACRYTRVDNLYVILKRKSSHPRITVITFKYDERNNSGMPNESDYQRLNEIEESKMQQLSDEKGYLYIGRETANNEGDNYFACKDFRKPSKVFFKKQQDNKFEVEYDIYIKTNIGDHLNDSGRINKS